MLSSGTIPVVRAWGHELVDESRKKLVLPADRACAKSDPPGWRLQEVCGWRDRGLEEDLGFSRSRGHRAVASCPRDLPDGECEIFSHRRGS